MLKVTNKKQFECMVELMEKNIPAAVGFRHKGEMPQGHYKKKWNEFAPLLNNIGPPTRDGDGWLKVWTDLKFKVKKKIVHNNRAMSNTNTSGKYEKIYTLSAMEERISNIIFSDAIFTPKRTAEILPFFTDGNIKQYGPATATTNNITNCLEEITSVMLVDDNSSDSKNLPYSNSNADDNLLQLQTESLTASPTLTRRSHSKRTSSNRPNLRRRLKSTDLTDKSINRCIELLSTSIQPNQIEQKDECLWSNFSKFIHSELINIAKFDADTANQTKNKLMRVILDANDGIALEKQKQKSILSQNTQNFNIFQ